LNKCRCEYEQALDTFDLALLCLVCPLCPLCPLCLHYNLRTVPSTPTSSPVSVKEDVVKEAKEKAGRGTKVKEAKDTPSVKEVSEKKVSAKEEETLFSHLFKYLIYT